MSQQLAKFGRYVPKKLQSWIGGRFVETASAERIPLKYAVTGQTLGEIEVAGPTEVDMAVEVAAKAQKEWAKWTPTERGRVLRKAADILTAKNDELALLETLDTSRAIQETDCVDIVSARDSLEYYGGLAPTVGGEFIHQPGQSWAYTNRVPLGVTCGIGAWNYPIQGAGWKAGPALACGNAMVFKPAEDTPLTALALAQVLQEAGLPDGLFNVVLGARETGQCLTRHPGISKVSFTGEMGTGIAICKDAADNLKKVQMELGGKSPLIIFESADIDEAVSAAMLANWYSTGQVCSNGTRVFVHESIKPAFIEKFVERTKKIIIGDPMDPKTQMGPLINHGHMEKVLEYVEIGRSHDKADLVYGGERLTLDGELAQGAFVSPAIFDNCTDDMRIVQEEVFGPLASVLTFRHEDEVIERANATPYGLSAGVFTNDIRQGHRVIREIEAGTTWINNYNLAPAEVPWTGLKGSGIGSSNGLAGIDEWTQTKSVYVEMNKVDCPYE